jgi:hypothetical protein
VIQEIRRVDKKNGVAEIEAVIGGGRGQVCFAATIPALKDEPARRLLSEGKRPVIGKLEIALLVFREPDPLWHEGLEGACLKRAKLAELQQSLEPVFFAICGPAFAGYGPPKCRIQWFYVGNHITQAAANGTILFAQTRIVIEVSPIV